MGDWDTRYIVTELRSSVGDAPWTPMFTEKEARRVLSLDNNVLNGGFYAESAWFWPGDWPDHKGEEGTIKEHTHEFPEIVAFIGSNPNDVYDLGGEIEIWIDGKRNILNKSFLAFLPAGVKHGPIRILSVTRPIFHFTAGPSGSYT
jgi:hypothetical protein